MILSKLELPNYDCIKQTLFFFQKFFTVTYGKGRLCCLIFPSGDYFLFTMILHYLIYHYNSLLKYLLSAGNICTELRQEVCLLVL